MPRSKRWHALSRCANTGRETSLRGGAITVTQENSSTHFILGSGEVEVTCNTGGATATWNLRNPGELITVVGFAFTICVLARTDVAVLVLDRGRFEALLNSQPSIVYHVMRGITRHVHGVVRALNMRAMELASYL